MELEGSTQDINRDPGIEKLLGVLNKRISKIVQYSLKRFINTYKEHPDFKDEEIPFIKSDIDKAEHAEDDLEKIVFVLGAGTSKSAGLPLAKEIIEYCQEAIGEDPLKKEVEKIRDELKKSKQKEHNWWISKITSDESNPTFEEVLSVYQDLLGSEEAINLLKEHFLVEDKDFPKKTLITLFNECLAHLARERLVDFIVTFNFDELLEYSINEDIGLNSYVKIESQAAFKWADTHGLFDSTQKPFTSPDQRPADRGSDRAKLWLLKPHGTISQENTLRHLIEQVGQFEKEKADVLKRIFKNSHIVVVGYSLSAVDLHKILITHALSGSIKGLYWVNSHQLSNKLGEDLKSTIEKVSPGCFYHIKSDADTFMLKLFRSLYSTDNFQKNEDINKAGLVPPFRHFVRAFAFQIDQGIECTFENRFILEMIIYSIRMKGWFSSRTINKCQQINHLINNATHTQRESIKRLPEKLKPFFISFPRQRRAERLFILRMKFINPVLNKNGNTETRKYSKLIELIPLCLPSELGGLDYKDSQILKFPKKISDIAITATKFGGKVLKSQDISPFSNYRDFATFNKILIIPNKAVLTALTDWLFSKDCNLYTVSETGRFIKNRIEPPTCQCNIINKYAGIAIGNYLRESHSIRYELIKSWLLELKKELYTGGESSEEFQDKLYTIARNFDLGSMTELNMRKPDQLFNELCNKIKSASSQSVNKSASIRGTKSSKKDKILQEITEEKEKLKKLKAYFYLVDIFNSIECIETIANCDKSDDSLKFKLMSPFRKRFHLHLWKDDIKKNVFGILFNRVDRQARTTFNWIKLDLDDSQEDSQFKAFLDYIESNK